MRMTQGVFTYLLQNLGAKDVQFEELISLEPDELRRLRYTRLPAICPASVQPLARCQNVHAC